MTEVYSPPRITEMARQKPHLGLAPGVALDLSTGWDFDIAERRRAARELIRAQRPAMVIGSTMCKRFCSFQHINDAKRSPDEVRRLQLRAMIHLRFMCDIYREQVESGQYFLHGHPEKATSWTEECIRAIGRLPGVSVVTSDQCQ